MQGFKKSLTEKTARAVLFFCAAIAAAAVLSITFYMLRQGIPGLFRVGIQELLFGRLWQPTGEHPSFGIFYIILTSVAGTLAAVLIGVPIGVLTAVFLAEIAPKKLAAVLEPAIELLAAIPSVVYGLIGIMLLNPAMYRLENLIYQNDRTHQFTGGANLISSVIVLAVMILPTVINFSTVAIRSVPGELKAASVGLGATGLQTIFGVILPAAKSGIFSAVVLGIGRAIGEAMAIVLVSGNSVHLPLPFHSVRFLTTAIVSEMSYAEGLHRQVLFTIGFILFLFIVGINLFLNKIVRREKEI